MGIENYRIARRARQDLDEIFDFIAADNVRAAVGVIEALHVAFAELSVQSEPGERCDEFAPGLRQFVAHRPAEKYVIFYRLREGTIEIARVLHGARNVQIAFDEVVGQGSPVRARPDEKSQSAFCQGEP